jgi:hypothetical protein
MLRFSLLACWLPTCPLNREAGLSGTNRRIMVQARPA